MVSPKLTRTAAPAEKPAKESLADKLLRPGLAQLAPNLEQIAYRGAVPLKAFVGWVSLVITVALLVGALGAHLLVQNRTEQLVEETTSRVAMQAQGRASVVAEWLKGLGQLADTVAGSEMVRIYVAELPKGAPAPSKEPKPITSEAEAIRAQQPYLEQWLSEFVHKNHFLGAQLVAADGQVLMSVGEKAAVTGDALVMRDLIQRGENIFRPLSVAEAGVVMDMVRPVRALAVKDAEGAPIGALVVRMPVGDKLSELLAATPLDQPGERTALLQHVAGDKAEIVGRTALAPLTRDMRELETTAQNGGKVTLLRSVVDNRGVFAILTPLPGTPLSLLQEYVAQSALGIMALYKPGIYLIVSLLVVILAALMLALTLHLMGQRNRTRVKLLGQTMEALVRVVESRDAYLAGHHGRVARLAIAVGNARHMDVGDRATLFYAAQLAAVGRLLVPRTVLAKKTKLTGAEREDLENHINQAISVLGDLDFDLPIVPVISQMYERVDGSGHPNQLKGDEINPLSKVLGACDAYVALTSERAHRKAFGKADALKAMQGGSFDADVVSAIKAVAK